MSATRKYFNPTYMKDLFLRLVGCESVSYTPGEVAMGQLIADEFLKADYFKDHPEYVQKHYIPNDPFGRFAVTAMVRGRGPKTVILLGHFDTVDYEGFGELKKYALDPYALMEHLTDDFLDEDAKKDFESGDWLFGRGTGDMKFGDAMAMSYVLEASVTEGFEGNVIYLGVPDEENNSAGMLAAVPGLNRIREQYGLEYQAVVNNEPHEMDDGLRHMDFGCVGKLMPAIFCVGKEGHSGLLFNNTLSAAPMLSAVLEELEFSMDYVDHLEDTYTLPTAALKIADNKMLYNVTMPYIAYTYFTASTLSMTPEDVMRITKDLCRRAADRLQAHIDRFTDEYEALTGERHEMKWAPEVLSYSELYEKVQAKLGSAVTAHMESFISELAEDAAMDERDATVAIVRELIGQDPDKSPKFVIAFIPPFYAQTINRGETAAERAVLGLAEKVKAYSAQAFGVNWKLVPIAKAISDNACCNVGDMSAAAQYLEPNMPLLGNKYALPLKELQAFNVPAINIGYEAKMLHQPLERMNLRFALEVAPELLSFAVRTLLGTEDE